MTSDLEARIRRLEDIEAIKMLKAKYWRCVDGKQWQELAECFSEDAMAFYGNRKPIKGRKAIMEFFSDISNSGKENMVGIHHGHNPEIIFTDNSTASGIWRLYNFRVDKQTSIATRNIENYRDEYIKVGEQWFIKSTSTIGNITEQFELENVTIKEL